jgi:hypothetical protein
MLIHLAHLDGQRNLGRGIDPAEYVPAPYRHRDLMHRPSPILRSHCPRSLTTADIALVDLQIGPIRKTRHLRPTNSGPAQGAHCSMGYRPQVLQVLRHALLR